MAKGFAVSRRIQFSEVDMAGVMHFANYYRLMEEVESAFWRSAGLSVMTDADGFRVWWPKLNASCRYLAPVHFEDELQLTIKAGKIGDRSVSYEVTFERKGERIAVGRVTAVCARIVDGKFEPICIPQLPRVKLEETLHRS
jgi:YbgC/YbaW family acyl-CoA thioester hydrolase